MQKRTLLLLINVALGVWAMAQTYVHREEHILNELSQPWLRTRNAAALGLQKQLTHGVSELGYEQSGGDYHRAQAGNAVNGLHFYSERYDKLTKNLVVWGSFDFRMDREKERAWSDVFDCNQGTPYLFGSSVKGNYDKQMFELHAKLSTIEKGAWTFGMGIDYKVGDLSRLRDPRPRSYLADYSAVPSVVYALSKNQRIGIDGFVRYRKEKMPSTSTVQEDPDLKYYTFFGVENADGVVGGYKGFQRQFVSNIYGGDVQYAYTGRGLSWVSTVGCEWEKQEILGNIKQMPGGYNSTRLSGQSEVVFTHRNLMVNASLRGFYNSGSADEYRQELITTRDTTNGVSSQEWRTLYVYNNRYKTNTYQVDLDYNIRGLRDNGRDFAWMAGADARWWGFDNRYSMPSSEFSADRFSAGLYGSGRLLSKKRHRIVLTAKVAYDFAQDVHLSLSETARTVPTTASGTFQTGSYEVANSVIIPDYNLLRENAVSYRAEAVYSFPLSFKKSNLVGYVKTFYNQTVSENAGSWMNSGITIGIIPQ